MVARTNNINRVVEFTKNLSCLVEKYIFFYWPMGFCFFINWMVERCTIGRLVETNQQFSWLVESDKFNGVVEDISYFNWMVDK